MGGGRRGAEVESAMAALDVTARVLYSKDPAHKKRKRWKDGFLVGKRVKDRLNLQLLDETGACLCSRSGLRCPTDDDIADDDGVVGKSFGSGGFQLQFDDFCGAAEVPGGAQQVLGEKNGGERKGVGGGKRGPYSAQYTRKPDEAGEVENVEPVARNSVDRKAAPLPVVSRKAFTRPRPMAPTPAPPHVHAPEPPRSTASRDAGPSGRLGPSTASQDDEILALFETGAEYVPPASLSKGPSQDSQDSLNELIYGRRGGEAPGRPTKPAAAAGASSMSDWSKKKPRLAQSSFQAPRVTSSIGAGVSTPLPGHGGGPAAPPSSGSLSLLSFEILSDRIVIPTAFSSVGEYRGVWIRAMVEEVQLRLGEAKKKLQNWAGFNKGKRSPFVGTGRVTRYERARQKRSEAGGDGKEPPKTFIAFDRKPYTKNAAMADTWVLGTDEESLRDRTRHGYVMRSVWHGVSSDDKLQVEPLGKAPPLNEPLVCVRGPNVSSELQIVDVLEGLDEGSSPLLDGMLGISPPKAPSSPSGPTLPEEITGAFELNASQARFLTQAWGRCLGGDQGPSISILHGPFGSGKTTVIVCLALLLARHSPRPLSVLVSANTNVAVDHVLNGLAGRGFEDLGRIGSVKKIDPSLLRYTVHSKQDSKKELVRDLREMLASCAPQERAHYEEELRAVETDRKAKASERLGRAAVVGVTCHSSVNPLLDDRTFDVVILDECSQIIEPLSLLPVVRSGARHLVAVGDPKQLPPVVASPAASRRGGPTIFRPLFTRLLDLGYPSELLDTQYRCHPRLSGLANSLFYSGALKDGVSDDRRAPLVPGLPPLALCDCRGKEERRGGSIVNEREARAVASILLLLRSWGVADREVGVLCFYREQCALVREVCRGAEAGGESEGTSCLIGTVDSFQGNERGIILLSTCSPQGARQVKFCADAKRLNVSLTRATHHLVVVGNTGVLGQDPTWAEIIRRSRVFAPGEPLLAPPPAEEG